jgi:hypothetical protein
LQSKQTLEVFFLKYCQSSTVNVPQKSWKKGSDEQS